MITGVVTPQREARVGLQVQDTGGQIIDINAVLDTGFNGYLTLPLADISSLGLPLREHGK